MIRRVVLLLVVANIALYFWRGHVQGTTEEVVDRAISSEVGPLVLLSERDGEQPEKELPEKKMAEKETGSAPPKVETTSSSATPEKPASSANKKRSCYSIGPLNSYRSVTQLSNEMARIGFQARKREKEVAGKAGVKHLVFIPVIEREKAEDIARELKATGISDFYISSKGFVALGVYSKKESALRRTAKLKKLGFSAVIKQEGKYETWYWLDLVQGKGDPLGQEQKKSILSKYKGAEFSTKACDRIALQGTSP